MKVEINGAAHDLADEATVADALAAIEAPGKGIAVAVDGQVVRRADWASTRLAANAAVEVLTAVQGG
ncbi:sulfur carrier protein ThiS [Pseudonocardia halophobica]|uniref:Thiamine biosynthesis protein ThiS n=1 Tax=Pseudonocardia halophobica TaxID=29401 RepID=A0A9W6NYH3_9PSEU|nr:sulfur carrier protein ThiS [Pseudonocardia halophobica]GLL13766.1 thiamine biosynthesis protein ThiS [Pseudonocardia halophobica]